MSRTGRLAIVLSHQHPDHTDPKVLDRLHLDCPIRIPDSDPGFLRWLRARGHRSVSAVGKEAATFGPFSLRGFRHLDSPFDGSVSIDTPDAFIFHGNDSYALSEESHRELARVKPAGKASVFLGLGGSASGYPLRYSQFSEDERCLRWKEKHAGILRALSQTAKKAGFDRVLAYASYARVDVEGEPPFFPEGGGDYAFRVSEDSAVLDWSPGDLYLPVEDRLISPYRSLDWKAHFSPLPEVPSKPKPGEGWAARHDVQANLFLKGLGEHVAGKNFRLEFEIELLDARQVVRIFSQVVGGGCVSAGRKICRVETSHFRAVLEGEIPFEDLYTGYLATWHREPSHVYHREFLISLFDYGYTWFSRASRML